MKTYRVFGDIETDVRADGYEIEQGALLFGDEKGELVEMFAPGAWDRVRVVASE